jgi:hypothetical protein
LVKAWSRGRSGESEPGSRRAWSAVRTPAATARAGSWVVRTLR